MEYQMDIKANMELVDSESILAVGSIVIDGFFTIHHVKAVKNKNDQNAWFVSLPQNKYLDEWKNVVSANSDINSKIKEAVFQGIKDQLILNDQNLPFEVKIQKICSGSTTLAKAIVKYNDAITISDIRIVKGKKGMFVSFPQQKLQVNGQSFYKDFITIPDNMKKALENKILREYDLQKNKKISASR